MQTDSVEELFGAVTLHQSGCRRCSRQACEDMCAYGLSGAAIDYGSA